MGIVKNIPNTITSMNLLCGVLGVIASLNGRLELAFVLMISAAAFDFCDGLAARLLKAYSEIGKELDSLADDVSFGVLPAVMLFSVSGTDIVVLKYLPLLLAVFSALRLAKFNLDERQATEFIGLPTPACAMFFASVGYIMQQNAAAAPPVAAIVASVVFSLLLISPIPMFALKFKHFDFAGNELRYIVLGISLVLLGLYQVRALPFIILAYILVSIVRFLIRRGKSPKISA